MAGYLNGYLLNMKLHHFVFLRVCLEIEDSALALQQDFQTVPQFCFSCCFFKLQHEVAVVRKSF